MLLPVSDTDFLLLLKTYEHQGSQVYRTQLLLMKSSSGCSYRIHGIDLVEEQAELGPRRHKRMHPGVVLLELLVGLTPGDISQ
jgi:hypothetical protein